MGGSCTLLIQVRERGNPRVMLEFYVDWDHVPRVGDRFIVPEHLTSLGEMGCEQDGEVRSVTWEPDVVRKSAERILHRCQVQGGAEVTIEVVVAK